MAKNPIPDPKPNWWQRHGNTAQIISAVVSALAFLGLLLNIGLTLWFHHTAPQVSDEHINAVIDKNSTVAQINSNVGTMTRNVEALSKRVENLEKAVETLADNQSKETQKIIERIIRAAQTSPPKTSARLLSSADSLILVARQERIPADQQYFEKIISILNSIAARTNNAPVDEAIHSSRISLAEYSSALQPLPPQYGELIFGPMEHALRIIGGRDQVYRHGRWDFRKVTGDAIVLEDNPINVTFEDSIIEGGKQPLDGIKWHGVTFIGSRITYQGGYTELENVRFVNCTFDAPPSSQGRHFLEMATLNLPKFGG